VEAIRISINLSGAGVVFINSHCSVRNRLRASVHFIAIFQNERMQVLAWFLRLLASTDAGLVIADEPALTVGVAPGMGLAGRSFHIPQGGSKHGC
jgi:hypothetical protein